MPPGSGLGWLGFLAQFAAGKVVRIACVMTLDADNSC
jgi:hypothetical protein